MPFDVGASPQGLPLSRGQVACLLHVGHCHSNLLISGGVAWVVGGWRSPDSCVRLLMLQAESRQCMLTSFLFCLERRKNKHSIFVLWYFVSVTEASRV